jgi:FtsH-binding integral membrane protein
MAKLMTSGYSWLIVLGAYMGVSYLADRWARSDTSPQMQYLGLGLFVVAEAIVFLPLLYIASFYAAANVIPTAAAITGFLFLGLTAVVFFTRKDFSWLRSILTIGGFIALGFIVASIIFGFTLGLLFSVVMVAYAAGAILYDTSNILHHYRTDQHVAASLALFASVALLFWYVLRIVMASSDD